MQRFGEWVSDPRLTLAALQAFTADPSRIAEPYLGDYLVWQSSGSSGQPGMFVQDGQSMAIYDALESIRRCPPPNPSRWLDPLGLGQRTAFVGAISGHFASIVSLRRLQRLYPWSAHATHCLSVLKPLATLVQELNALQPGILISYPSVVTALAEQQAQGRRRLRLREIWTGGEGLRASERQHISASFGCGLRNHYGASEFFSLAFECACGQLHANTDWLILEPVDEQGRPVPAGQPSATTLLTHLGNRVQPIVRYDLGDHITVLPGPCACGSPLPVLQVSGRKDAPLRMPGLDGQPVLLLPLALTTLLEDQAGLFAFQLCQREALTLELRVPQQGAQVQCDLQRAGTVLQRFLAEHGVQPVQLVLLCGVEPRRGASGKSARIVAA
jgi:phenylacetate-coenzyme A ligase PaaK-like adenylate-forming protein